MIDWSMAIARTFVVGLVFGGAVFGVGHVVGYTKAINATCDAWASHGRNGIPYALRSDEEAAAFVAACKTRDRL